MTDSRTRQKDEPDLKRSSGEFVNENQDDWDVHVLLSSAAPFYLAKDQELSVKMYCKMYRLRVV